MSTSDLQEPFRSILSAIPEGVVFLDRDGRVVFCNPCAVRLLGLQPDWNTGRTAADLFDRALRQDTSPFPVDQNPAVVTQQTGRPCRDVVMGWRRPDGSVAWFSVASEPLQSGDNPPYCVVTTFRDVTPKCEAELIANRTESLHRTLVENQGEGAGIIDFEGRFVFANPSGEEILGVPPGTLAGRSLFEFVSPGTAALIHTHLQARLRGERSDYDLEIRRESDQATRTLLVSATPQVDAEGRIIGSIGIFRDITDRKRVEDALQESEERLRLATEANRLGWFDIYPQTGKRVWSPLTKQFFGFSAEAEIAFEDFIKAVHPDDRERVRQEVIKILSPGHGPKSYSEFRTAQGEGGKERWMASWGRAFFDDRGRPVRLIGITQDISERKRAEQTVRESESWLRLTFDQAPIGAVLVDLQSRFFRVNDAFCRFLGYAAHELIGVEVWSITHPDHLNVDRRNVRRLEDGEIEQYQTDKRYLRKDGSVAWGHVTLRLVRDETGRALYFMSMVEDINDRKHAEEEREKLQLQLLHAQKMESIGRLAGGVAHDFNNLLTVINGYSALALKRLGEQDPLREIIREVHNAGDAAAALVRQLLAFGRKQFLRKEPVDLNAMIAGMEKTLLPLLGEQVEVRTALQPAVSAVVADRHQVEQVILNLAVNARDAMPEGGMLVIETAEVTCGPYCRRCLSPIGAGRYVCVTVRDNGTGMDEQTRQHLFEPFFSTKTAQHGTGLGLATVHGIILQSGGHIDVESRLGAGTAFFVFLPVAGGELTAVIAETEASGETSARAGETILLVEDQPEVRRLTASVLQECGYGVLEAASAEEALQQVAKESVDLVLTDVVLPRMSGCELAAQVQSRQPGAKVLFMSGYSDEILKNRAVEIRAAALIQKPFAPSALAEKIRQVLGPGLPQ